MSKLDLNPRRSFQGCRHNGRNDCRCAPGQRLPCQVITPASGQETHWISSNAQLPRLAAAKVTGRRSLPSTCARDMQRELAQQSHTLTIHIPRADRIYEGPGSVGAGQRLPA